jgi:hypothetical protein
MKGKVLPMIIALISAASLVFMMMFFHNYSFSEWLGYFFLAPLIFSILELINDNWIDSQKRILSGFLVGVVLFTLLSRTGFNLFSVYKILLALAGCGVVWLFLFNRQSQKTNNQISE